MTVAEHTCQTYATVFEHLRVVIRADDSVLQDCLQKFTDDIVICRDAHLGMGHSLAAGISGLDWQWAFVGLLDMPYIRVDTLQQLRDIASNQVHPAILRPRLPQDGKDGIPHGHPIGWHHSYFEQLRACRGDQGARELLRQHHDAIIAVQINDPGIQQDIDTPDDLAAPQ